MQKSCLLWLLTLSLLCAPLSAGALHDTTDTVQADDVQSTAATQESASIFSAVSSSLGQNLTSLRDEVTLNAARDLHVSLTADKLDTFAGDVVTLSATLENPRFVPALIKGKFSLSDDRFEIAGDGATFEIAIPAATLSKNGEAISGKATRTYQLTAYPASETDEGLLHVDAAITMQENSRWYQDSKTLTIHSARISAVLESSVKELWPEDAFYYQVTLTNSGSAQGEALVKLRLPDGITYAPNAATAMEQSAQDLKSAIGESAVSSTPGEPDEHTVGSLATYELSAEEDNTLSCRITVPAGTYEGSELAGSGSATINIPVTVDADALADYEKGKRVLVCEASLDGARLTPLRVTAVGAIVECTLDSSVNQIHMGEVYNYTFTLSNSGYAPADVAVSVKLPKGLRFARFVSRGLSNKVAGDTLSWQVHLDEADADMSGNPIPYEQKVTYQVKADELSDGIRATIMPVTSVYQVGGQNAKSSNITQTRIIRPSFMGMTMEDWFILFWGALILTVTALTLYVMVKREERSS